MNLHNDSLQTDYKMFPYNGPAPRAYTLTTKMFRNIIKSLHLG